MSTVNDQRNNPFVRNHHISVNDLDTKVAPKLPQYFEKPQAKRAIKALKQWYIDERFDDDDFINDWKPNDYENCDGIDIFMNKLIDLSQANNEQNKRVVFDWICYWLYPNINEPTEEPIRVLHQLQSNSMLIEQIGIQLAELLRFDHTNNVNPQQAQDIGNFFVKLCRALSCTRMDKLRDKSSMLVDKIAKTFNDIEGIHKSKKAMLNLLKQYIFYDIKLDLDSFQFWFTKGIFKEAKKIRKTVPALFQGEFSDKPSPQRGNKGNTDDGNKLVMYSKCIDFMNGYPLLSNLADVYIRCIAHQHHQYWEENKDYLLQDLLGKTHTNDKNQVDVGNDKDPGDWYDSQERVRGNFCHSIKQRKNKGYYNSLPSIIIKYGLKGIIKRILPKFRFSIKATNKIHDSYNVMTKIAIAMNKWVYDKTMSSNTRDKQLKYFPMQIDLWIIPRLVKTSGSNKTHGSKYINNQQFDAGWCTGDSGSTASNDQHEEQMESQGGAVLNLRGQAEQLIWDIEDQLKYEYTEHDREDIGQEEKSSDEEEEEVEVDPDDRNWEDGYEKDEDYFINNEFNFDEMTIQEIYRAINELWETHNEREQTLKGHIGWKNKSYRRYILIIDRRNPQHIRNETMMDDTDKGKTWKDKMYLIEPKKCYTISKQYAYVLNETFAANTQQYLLPMFEKRDKDDNPMKHLDTDDLGGGDDVNGYKIMISYHLYFREKVKMYFYKNHEALRFFMDDIKWLWPRLFKLEGDQFQKLTEENKLALHDALTKHKLKDRDFERFLKSSIANEHGETWYESLKVEEHNW